VLSFLLFLAAVIMSGFAIFDNGNYAWYNWQGAIVFIIASFITSPYGLPKIAVWLVCKVDDLNDLIKSI